MKEDGENQDEEDVKSSFSQIPEEPNEKEIEIGKRRKEGALILSKAIKQ